MAQRLVRYVKPLKFFELTGYSVKAVERKIEEGVWREGREYRIVPDRRMLIACDCSQPVVSCSVFIPFRSKFSSPPPGRFSFRFADDCSSAAAKSSNGCFGA